VDKLQGSGVTNYEGYKTIFFQASQYIYSRYCMWVF